LLGEQLLGQLHELVADVTKDIDMSEDQEYEYQRLMGAMDEAMKASEVQKTEALAKLAISEKAKSEIDLQIEDLIEKVKQLDEQNVLLRNQAKEYAEKQKELKVMKSEEFEKIEKEKTENEEKIREQSNETSKAIAKIRQLEEELSDMQIKHKKQDDEMIAIAKQMNEKNIEFKTLENKYKHVKEKYAEIREGNLKKYEARYAAKVKEIEASLNAKYAKDSENQENEIDGDNPSGNLADVGGEEIIHKTLSQEPKLPEAKSEDQEQDSTKLDHQIKDLICQLEIVKNELSFLQSECQTKDDTIRDLETTVEDLGKRVATPAQKPRELEIDSPGKGGLVLNPKRLMKLSDLIEAPVRQLYKDFIIYSADNPNGQVVDMQMRMNSIIEHCTDMRDYIKAKLATQ
jgi:myosin heavy subunit